MPYLDQVANLSVRNRGTLAGNLMLKHADPAFPSDVFVLLEAAGAKVGVMEVSGTENVFELGTWLAKPMDKKILTRIILPDLPKSDYQFRFESVHILLGLGLDTYVIILR